jgi:two-component system, cell cycle response regulator DivK
MNVVFAYGSYHTAPPPDMTESASVRSPDDDPRRIWRAGFWGPQPERRETPPPRSRRAGLVLIVDDSADARELYAMYLNHVGFSVRAVADGQAAIDAAVELRPDVIVMDLSMPQVDGITATQRLRLHPRTRDVPVILLTGFPQKAIERGALEAGVDVFLTKPCLPEDLEAHVRRLMESKRGTT